MIFHEIGQDNYFVIQQIVKLTAKHTLKLRKLWLCSALQAPGESGQPTYMYLARYSLVFTVTQSKNEFETIQLCTEAMNFKYR